MQRNIVHSNYCYCRIDMVAKSGSDSEKTRYRTAIIPVTLSGANYRLAHNSCHSAALLWNQGVDWVHAQWKAKRSPNKYDIQSFLNSLPLQDRPLHAHTTETIAHDLSEVITTSRTNNKNGMKVRSLGVRRTTAHSRSQRGTAGVSQITNSTYR